MPNANTNSSPPASYLVCRGVRGATTADANTAPAILEATRDLLERLISANGIEAEDIASVWFTTTPDLNAEYPALAARQLGWHDTALMCSHEMAVPHGLKACIRVLIHWNTTRSMRAWVGTLRRAMLRRRIRKDPVPYRLTTTGSSPSCSRRRSSSPGFASAAERSAWPRSSKATA